MFEVKIKAPKDKSIVVEVTRPINVDTPERAAVGQEMERYFARAGEKAEFTMFPGDEMEVGEFDPKYRSLADVYKGENAKREAEISGDVLTAFQGQRTPEELS